LKLFLKYILFLLILNHLSKAEVLWAHRVIGYSSQACDKQFAAKQILGSPSVLSGFGTSPCAWMPGFKDIHQKEWIEVEFSKYQQVRQICIVENHYPGAVKKIILIDTLGNEHIVMNNPDRSNNCESGAFNMSFELTDYFVKGMKLELEFDSIKIPQIDAVGISNNNNLISWDINLVKDFKKYDKSENFGSNINSEFAEISPIISPDSKFIFFTRDKHPENRGTEHKQDVWISKIDKKDNFSLAENLGEPINNSFNNSTFSISPDGSRLFLTNAYRDNGSVTKGISYSIFFDKNWLAPKPMLIKNYQNINSNADYFISSEEKYLLLSIEDNNSKGGMDLYVSFRLDDSSWSEPINLGDVVNTADDEITPFLDTDNKTLYFSSRGHCGLGSQDIFVTNRLDDSWTKWSKPQNLGTSLNSSLWDAYLRISPNRDFVYFSSYNNSFGDADIFKSSLLKLISINGIVKDDSTGKPIESEIIIRSMDGKEVIRKALSDKVTGAYKCRFEHSGQFVLQVLKSDFLPVTEMFDLTKSDSISFERNFNLPRVKLDSLYRLKDILFQLAEYELPNRYIPELESIVNYLTNFPEKKIEIIGHTDDIGSENDNYQLSIKRANFVKEYLIRSGINQSRIRTVGLGKSKPICPNTKEIYRQQNRRVEYVFFL
jgi:outer membrane protein OmpA-like peptidoglycan-associated protein